MDRRTFIQTGLAACCAPALGAVGPAVVAGPAVRAEAKGLDGAGGDGDKIIMSAPLTHSDWMLKPGMAWGDEGVRHMLDACKACGWTRVYWRALDGGRSLYHSKLMRPQGRWDEDNFWAPAGEADRKLSEHYTPGVTAERRAELVAKFASLDYAHFDSLASAVSYGHQIGLQIHAWISVNEDDHGWGLQSEFSKAHPQFRWRRRDGRFYHSQLSFVFNEMRQYKLAIIRELLRGYKIDGLFLDWIRTGDVRDNPQTDAHGVADSGYEDPLVEAFQKKYGLDPHEVPNGDERWVRLRSEPQTLFMREVRKLSKAMRPGIPVAALVGHPWHYRGELDKIAGNLDGLLLDVAGWASEGLVDAVVPAGYYRDGGTPELAQHALRSEVGDRVDVWCYAWVPQTVSDFERDFELAKELGDRQMLFWEADYIDDRSGAAALEAAMSARSASA